MNKTLTRLAVALATTASPSGAALAAESAVPSNLRIVIGFTSTALARS